MLSFEPELERIRALIPRRADELIARERREVFSVHPEVRILAWGGAMLLATAAGVVLKNNLERIGPIALAAMIGLAAIACYAFVSFRRTRASLIDDYVLLLGALLVSADVAFIESQFHLFGEAWYRHFLLLAVLHGAAAYLYQSRTLLTLAIVAMASWMGVQQAPLDFMGDAEEMSLRLLGCVALVMMWRAVNRREAFNEVLEHFAMNFLVLAPFVQMFEAQTRTTGCLMTMLVAAMIIHFAFRQKRELSAIYGLLYFMIALDVLLIHLVRDELFAVFLVIVSTIGTIAALFMLHNRFREMRA